MPFSLLVGRSVLVFGLADGLVGWMIAGRGGDWGRGGAGADGFRVAGGAGVAGAQGRGRRCGRGDGEGRAAAGREAAASGGRVPGHGAGAVLW
jgi:hypothetical protein